jgi:hypothetical protein
MLRFAAFTRTFGGASSPMSLFRCLIPPLLLLLNACAHAEQALQLSAN